MLRIISGQASNAEQQERIFNHIKRITRHTSNYHPGQIIPNLFVRLQAEREMGLQEDDAANQQAYISSLTKCLLPPTNTQVPLSLIKKHNREWQAHLQQISDFLLEGEGMWWNREAEAIVFNDITSHPNQVQNGPSLHHFRSSSLSKEKAYLHQCWEKCVRDNITIPAYIIRVDQEDGSTKVIHATHLEDPEGSTTQPDCHTKVPEDTEHDIEMETADEPEVTLEQEAEKVLEMSPAEDEVIYLSDSVQPSHDHGQSLATSGNENKEPCLIDQLAPLPKSPSTPKPSSLLDPQDVGKAEYMLQSCLGKAVAVVLGNTKEVKQLDKRHCQLKQAINRNCNVMESEGSYRDILAPIQVKILSENTNVRKLLSQWEKEFCMKNNLVAPTYEAMKTDATASLLLKKIKNCKALLKQWKIEF